MKNIINIFIKPGEAIADITSEEPVFSGILIFVIAVLAGNINSVNKVILNTHSALFYPLILLMLWAAALIFADIILTGVLKLINPLSSGILDVERFRKLFIAQLFIAEVLIIKPVLALFISDNLAWVLVSIWAAVLILITIVNLWSVTEIKAVVSALSAVVILYVIVNFVLSVPVVFNSDKFMELKSLSENILPAPQVSLLGLRKPDYGDKAGEDLKKLSDKYISSHRKDAVYSYAEALKAEAYLREGKVKEAELLYRQILSSRQTPSSLYNSVKLKLYSLLTAEDFVMLDSDRLAYRWVSILNFLKIPSQFGGYRANVRDGGLVKTMINAANISELAGLADRIALNWKGTVFEDDILFWTAERFLKSGDSQSAARYYRKAESVYMRKDEDRYRAESVLYFIERLSGQEEIFNEKLRAPQALASLAGLYKSEQDLTRAKEVYGEILNSYPISIFAADSLFELAQIAEQEGDFEKAIKLYSSLLNRYEISDFRAQAEHKRDIITNNLKNKALLSDYSRGWKMWQNEKYGEAINIYKEIINKYRTSEIAYELQYNLGNYYRDIGDYMKALHEFRNGYSNFKNTPRGFDFARRIGNVLGEDLGYWRRALNWYNEVLQEYEPGYVAEFSNASAIELAWKAADISREQLRDYKAAKKIYSDIINKYSDKDIAARAMYELAYIDEIIYRRYSDAVSQYRKIITGYPGTEWKETANKRMEDIYRRGTNLLEQYR
ncbi:MAG: tetratricopeptide repeat protein [Elusimicrobia bacterium]|jgi:TolA-binding protein|nr:tetratricopeptide repeat protein [Elusimicrobiota bacterium]